jgi:hypothetical protein
MKMREGFRHDAIWTCTAKGIDDLDKVIVDNAAKGSSKLN